MGRPRKIDRHLPACMYCKHGAYYHVVGGTWHPLGRDLSAALAAYASRIQQETASGLSAILDRVIERAEAKLKPATVVQYRRAAAKIAKAFAEFAPGQVQPTHVAQFMDHFRHQPCMANRMRSVLKMAFDHAVLLGLCPANPVTSVPRHEEQARDRYLSDAEYRAIHAAGSPVLRAIMDIAYLTGQRIGDVLAIHTADCDPAGEGIAFRQQKTGKRLLVRWNDDLRGAVDSAKAIHGGVPKMYLLAQRNGKIRSYRGVRDLFDRAAAKAKVQDAHLHDLRAKAITDAKAQGLNPKDLAGHSTEAMTNRYIRSRETTVADGPSFRQAQKILDKRKRN